MSGVDSPVAAQQVFTNRSGEVAAFEQAIDAHHRMLGEAGISPVVDRVQGRCNVLGFYGVGGIGKTTLSHELERRLVGGIDFAGPADVAAIRIDLAEAGATDIEMLLLRLRAGLGRLGSRWSAFDVALACYWARAHAGEALQEFLDSSPMVRRVARSVGLGDQITENVDLVAPIELGGLTGLAQKAALGAYRAIRDRVREGRLMADCDLFAELVEAEATYENFSFFPYLLAWDLDRRRGNRPIACVFLDTFEVLAGQADRTVERYVQRMIYLMPNVLFVITGRNRIDWADHVARGELDFTGRDRWPNLHFANETDEPRQHLVGYLSDSDADSYLREALVRNGESAIPEPVRERIIAGGQGLPLYLDLSVSHFVELLARDRQPSPDDFGGSFTAVATRSIRDLPPEERDLVRTAALVDRFDAALLRAGQPGVTDGTVARFVRRAFLTYDDAYELPYALHLSLRSAVAEADRTMADGWSDRDRHEVASRLLAGLGARIDHEVDRSTIAHLLETGLKLAGEHNVFDDWLATVTQRLIEAGQWASIGAWLPPATHTTVEFQALRAAIDGVMLRRTGRAPEAVGVLDGTDDGLPADSVVGQLVRLHLAHALRNTGDYSSAADTYRGLVGGEFDRVARYWLCDHDFLNGRFTTALGRLNGAGNQTPAETGEHLRLIGHILRVNARFDAATETYSQAINLARTEGLAAAEAKALTNLAQTACWRGDTVTVADTAEQARALLDLVPNPVENVKLRAAEAVAAALGDDTAAAAEIVEDTRRLAEEIGYRGGHNLADVASILADALTGDHDRGRATLNRLDERTRASGGNTYWVPIAASWLDSPTAADHTDGIEWLDGADETLRRWATVAGR